MPEYKVYYFNVKALGEPLRFLMTYGNIPFEDIRVSREDWPALKPSMPMGQMPVLEVDGKRVHQSVAISRYLAKQVKLNGADDWEDLQIDTVVDTINDFRLKISQAYYEADEASKAKKYEVLKAETIPFYLTKLDEIIKENNGFFANKKLSWADLCFVAMLDFLDVYAKTDLVTASHPNLLKLVENVRAIPSIKAWIAKRPVTEI